MAPERYVEIGYWDEGYSQVVTINETVMPERWSFDVPLEKVAWQVGQDQHEYQVHEEQFVFEVN